MYYCWYIENSLENNIIWLSGKTLLLMLLISLTQIGQYMQCTKIRYKIHRRPAEERNFCSGTTDEALDWMNWMSWKLSNRIKNMLTSFPYGFVYSSYWWSLQIYFDSRINLHAKSRSSVNQIFFIFVFTYHISRTFIYNSMHR